MMDDRTLERKFEKMARGLANIVCRGVAAMTGDKTKWQTQQVQLLDGETIDGAERVQQYGFSGVPQGGAECIVLMVNGDRSHPVILACDDRRYRVAGLQNGEVCVYTDEGDRIHLKRDNTIEVTTKHFIVKAQEDVQIETKQLTIKAETGVNIDTAATVFNTDALTFGGQGGGDCTAQMSGGIVATGDLASNGGAVSLNGHVHEGVQPGDGNTKKPVGGK